MGREGPNEVEEKEDDLSKELRAMFPHGHPHFIVKLLGQMDLHSRKNEAYAGGGDPLGNFKRVAMILSLYPNFPYDTPTGVAFIYALKQMDCEAWSMCQGREDKVEGYDGRTDDQAVYANLRSCLRYDEKGNMK